MRKLDQSTVDIVDFFLNGFALSGTQFLSAIRILV